MTDPEESCEACGGKEEYDCEFCDGEGNCYVQVDVDAEYRYSCNCEDGKRPCPDCRPDDILPDPEAPSAAWKIAERNRSLPPGY